ncbi:uncharacterized protein EAF01_006645 [Botrytis porri]|uniref:BTB domain-containing protein n=1 Tax=Botrytis porri TaxID=87229 RepID=A0A4Z1KW22_9HELO|nr:uncharacterized protein EAF01_006645 [Botrytis porri]KAF7903596.1 hypothetical protein EAF01_006645 [Botrytis porri]TGO88742.1 hypothetical protein BPOR_0144g00120 [Botrytis porri]
MAISSSANIIVDPGGDLVLLLNPTIRNSSKSDSSSSANPVATGSKMIRSLQGEISETSQHEPTPIYSDHILVSSKHMSLASPIFKAMLQGGFREAITLKEIGRLEVPLPDDHPAAMKILINMIHGRMNSIPLRIDLKLFTWIAILVDKYRCAEVIGPYPSIWKMDLQDWTNSSSDVARWLCIAWQFELHEEFLRATKLIQLQSTCDLETTIAKLRYNLPIPKKVTDKIEMCRQEGIRKAVKFLENFITMYQKSDNRCTARTIPEIEYKDTTRRDLYGSYGYPRRPIDDQSKQISFLNYDEVVSYRRDCDSMLLGSLTKSLIEHGLFPLPPSPYTSWSIKYLRQRIELLEASSLCSRLLETSVVRHDVIDGLKKSVRTISVLGLTLKDGKKLVSNK